MPNTTAPLQSASSLKRWIAFFLLICVIALIWLVPASVLPRLLAMSNAGTVVHVSNTSGTLWSGQADEVLINANQQQLLLENVSWRFNWRSLLSTQLCLDIYSSPTNATDTGSVGVEGQSCFFRSGAIHLNELLFYFPASLLVSAQLRDSPLMRTLSSAVRVEGDITGTVNNLVWHRGQLIELIAQGLWSDAEINMQLPDARTFGMRQQQLRFGALPWTAQSRSDNQLFLQVRSSEPELNSEADLQVDSQSDVWLDGRYTTQLQLGVVPSTPQFLRDILTIFAEPQGSGVYRLVWSNTGV